MKKTFVLLITLALLSACSQTSDWKKIIISKNDLITFEEPSEENYLRRIILLTEDNDTIFISNSRLLERTCYLKMAYPNNNIIIEYVTVTRKKGAVNEVRFINIE